MSLLNLKCRYRLLACAARKMLSGSRSRRPTELLSFPIRMPVDSAARNPEFQRQIRLQTEAFACNTPYHSLELLDGTIIPGLIPIEPLRGRLSAFPLPADLTGKRVLDIGAASG